MPRGVPQGKQVGRGTAVEERQVWPWERAARVEQEGGTVGRGEGRAWRLVRVVMGWDVCRGEEVRVTWWEGVWHACLFVYVWILGLCGLSGYEVSLGGGRAESEIRGWTWAREAPRAWLGGHPSPRRWGSSRSSLRRAVPFLGSSHLRFSVSRG